MLRGRPREPEFPDDASRGEAGLGYDWEAWTAMTPASTRAEDDDPERDPWH